ncbi:spermatogenesis-associated protein 31D3-like, partial [Bos indicus]|uniref:Spermatogenesis-associated protein 31D3-like n=1 Tax=Bos indicus TaxID=9915 RepID=A0ABM4SR50_BOSIN
RSAISGIVCSSSPVSALAWWQEAAKAWSFSTLRHLESKQEHLPSHPPEASFWGDPKKQLEKGRTLSSLVKKSQQVFSQVTSNLPQENRSSWAHSTVLILPEDLASPEVWEELEHQFSKRFMQQQFGLPCRIRASQKLMQP